MAVMRRAVVDVLQKRGLWVMVFKESTHRNAFNACFAQRILRTAPSLLSLCIAKRVL
jgi:hypothetical protein